MKKTSFYFGLVLVMMLAVTFVSNEAKATTTSSGYNTPVIRSAFNFTAVLNAATGHVDMTWVPYAPTSFNYYKIVRSTTKTNPFYPEDGYIYYSGDSNVANYTDTDVPTGTSYYRVCSIAQPYRYCSPVATIINTGSSVNTNTNVSEEGTIMATAKEESGKVRITWTAEGNFPYGFKIAKSMTHTNPTYPVMTGDSYYYLSDSATRSYLDSAVEKGTTYYYRVCRYSSNGTCSLYSNPVSITLAGTSSGSVIETPVSLTLTAQEVDQKVVLSWSGSGTILHGFKIAKSMTHENPTYPVMSGDMYVYLSDSNVRTYEDSDVAAGKKYYYSVCQYDGNGACLSYSNSVHVTLSGTVAEGEDITLKDISGSVFSGAIKYMIQKGIIQGYGDKTFRPYNFVTRAEFIKMVVEAKYSDDIINACLDSDDGNNLFTDVSKTDWFAKYVCVAKMKNIIAGYDDGTFKPGQHVNMAEAAKILVNTFGVEIPKEGKIWYVRYIFALQAKKFIPWTIAGLHAFLKRSEVAEMMWRVLEKETEQDSRDDLVE